MEDWGVRFEPIPRECPIPRNVVGLIGGYYGFNPTFVLSLNGAEIVIQAPTDPPGFGTLDDFDPENPFYDWLTTERFMKIYAHYLEIIQALLGTVKFGKTNWAYLLHNARRGPGGYTIVQRERILPKVTCPPWAPFIHESEVEFTVYGMAGDRRGIWNGKEVDILYGWNEHWTERLDKAMYGYKFVEGMDLTFEVYGHLIASDGSIIGIVTEAAWGRMPTLDDRTRVYQAIIKIQRRGALYRACLTNRFMIANGKVRLLDLTEIVTKHRGKPEELESEAERWHWKELDQLFYEIQTLGPYGDYRVPFARFTTSYKDLECMPLLPSLDRPLGGIMLYPDFFRNFYVDPWPEYQIDDEDNQQSSNVLEIRHKLNTHRRGAEIHITHGTSITSSWDEEEDRPLSRARLQHRPRPRVSFHPYHSRQKREKLLAGSEDTSTSYSEEIDGVYAHTRY